MKINKGFLVSIAGFIWGLSGFTVEVFSSNAASLQVLVRLFFVLMSSAIITMTLKIKINRKYYFAIGLFLMYFMAYLTTSMMHGIVLPDLLRELLLLTTVLVIYILFSNNMYIFNFIKGLFVSLGILVTYYFLNIDFLQIFASFYRLFTGLNPNGIGTIAVMTFTLSYFFFLSKEYTDRQYFYLGFVLMSLIVVLATRSRTAMVMLAFSFIAINIYFKNKKILLASLITMFLIIAWKFDVLETILRLKTPEGYVGEKNIYNLTGRTEIWAYGLDLIKENLLFGVGPKDAYTIVDGHKASFHNAFIQLFVTVGLFGFVPILIMVLLSLRAIRFSQKHFLVKAIFLVGIVGSMAESRLFNFGSPGNLLFLISLLYLMGIDKKAKI